MYQYFLHKFRKDKRVKGYMTVEASFVVPWVVFLFVFLIYASFYLYDKCILFQDAYTVCFRGSVQKEEDGVLNYINSHMDGQFGRKYFGVGNVQGKVTQSGQEVRVYAACSVKVPFGNFLTMAGESGWQIQTEAKAQIINPTEVIRKCRMAENILDWLRE